MLEIIEILGCIYSNSSLCQNKANPSKSTYSYTRYVSMLY